MNKLKIIHICLASHYTEGMAYQDNLLPDQNAIDGHEVIVVSDNQKYSNDLLVNTSLEDKRLSTGVRLIRVKYDYIINKVISSKIRKVSSLKSILFKEKPDVILFHGASGYELLTVAKYKKKYPMTKLYIDSHSDYHNSGKNWLSLFLQYKLFNRTIIKVINKYVNKYLYISLDAKNFLLQEYKLSHHELEFFPLGGYVINENDKQKVKAKLRKYHNIPNNHYTIVHSGKFDMQKKTIALLKSFNDVNAQNIHLFLIGEFSPDIQEEALSLISDGSPHIHFLGWKDATTLKNYLMMADLYCQPGSQSATLQNAICSGAPIAVYPHESHKSYMQDNGVYISNSTDLKKLLKKISAHELNLKIMSKNSLKLGENLLDYTILAKRLYK